MVYLKPHKRETVRATVLQSSSGLARIQATTEEPGWIYLDTVLNSGFKARLKSNIDAPVPAAQRKTFAITFRDDRGDPAPLDADAYVTLHGSKLKFYDPRNMGWVDDITFKVDQGANVTPPVEFRSFSWAADTGLISAEVRTSPQGIVLHDEDFWITVTPRWYVPLLISILGSFMYSVYKLSKEAANAPESPRRILSGAVLPGLATSILSGSLAYLLADWGVLGIKVDTTSLQGFFILGFLFSYVGIDFVLRTVTRREEPGGAKKAEQVRDPSQSPMPSVIYPKQP
jgi:hypothetical protein